MQVFEYSALDLKGKSVTGVIDAGREVAVRPEASRLTGFSGFHQRGRPGAEKKEPGSFSFGRPFARIRLSEISMMTRQLAASFGAGFPVGYRTGQPCLSQPNLILLKNFYPRSKRHCGKGSSFAAAISQYPGTFYRILYINKWPVNNRAPWKSYWTGWRTSPKSSRPYGENPRRPWPIPP